MEKIKEYLAIVAIFLMMVIMVSTCGTRTKIEKLTKEINHLNSLDKQRDSIINVRIKSAIEVEGLKISKRNLYDQNAIVRTAIRPDDRMVEYDNEIKKLTK